MEISNLYTKLRTLEAKIKQRSKSTKSDGFNYIFRLDLVNGIVVANCFRVRGAKSESITLGRFMSRAGSKIRVILPTAPPDVQAEFDRYTAGKPEPLQVPAEYKPSTLLAVKLTKELAVN